MVSEIDSDIENFKSKKYHFNDNDETYDKYYVYASSDERTFAHSLIKMVLKY